MLISRQTHRRGQDGHGCPEGSFAELRSQLARPSAIPDRSRQRLLDLSRRLAAVQALGGDFARVEFSKFASVAVRQHAVTA